MSNEDLMLDEMFGDMDVEDVKKHIIEMEEKAEKENDQALQQESSEDVSQDIQDNDTVVFI